MAASLNIGFWLSVFVLAWLGGLAALIGYRLLTGAIPLVGLLGEEPERGLSPERLAPIGASALVLAPWGTQWGSTVPEIPAASLGLLALGHAAFLGGKALRRLGKGRHS